MLAAVFGLTVGSRAFAASRVPINWDAVQYVMGLLDFDVVKHQPHPPGSILYEGLGWVAMQGSGDPHQALIWLSVLASAASVVLCYVTCRELFGRALAVAATALFATSPLSWFYGAVALPYALEAALALCIVLLSWRAMDGRRPREALLAAAVLGIAGGVRQTTAVLLFPMWLLATWLSASDPPLPHPTRRRARQPAGVNAAWRRQTRVVLAGLAILGALCLAWAVPLIWLSGGIAAYVSASRQLSSLAAEQTSLASAGLAAVGANVQYEWDVASFGLNLGLVYAAVYVLPGRLRQPWPWHPTSAQRWFLVLWAAPAVGVYSLAHIGQAGYLMLIWPLACVATAQATYSAGALVGARVPALARSATPLLVVLAAGSGIALFLAPLRRSADAIAEAGIRTHDSEWRSIQETVDRLGRTSTIVLTGTRTTESFRLASWLLPDVHVFAVGQDRDGTLGVAFSAFGGEHDYDRFMAGDHAARSLAFPAGTRRALILDRSVAALMDPAAVSEVAISSQRAAWVYPPGGGERPLEALRFPRALTIEPVAP